MWMAERNIYSMIGSQTATGSNSKIIWIAISYERHYLVYYILFVLHVPLYALARVATGAIKAFNV
jgi:hypothetical protein